MDSLFGITGHLNLVTKPELRLPPRGVIKFMNVEVLLALPVEEDFMLNGVVGADGSTPKDFRICIPKNRLRSFISQALHEGADYQALLNEFFTEFLMKA